MSKNILSFFKNANKQLTFLACCMDMHMQALRTTFDFFILIVLLKVFSGLVDKKSDTPQKKNVYLMEKSGFSQICTTWNILAN